MTDSAISAITRYFDKETKKAEWGSWRFSWYTRRGALRAVCHNIREALNEAHYKQLEDDLMSYKRVTIGDYIRHLDDVWCKMDTKAVTKMTAAFYEPSDQVMHITKFAKQLTKQ